ncbi:MAG: hypothetical protein AAGA90_15660 [Actinomycetota bacterium]
MAWFPKLIGRDFDPRPHVRHGRTLEVDRTRGTRGATWVNIGPEPTPDPDWYRSESVEHSEVKHRQPLFWVVPRRRSL